MLNPEHIMDCQLSHASVLVTVLLFPFGSMFPPPKYLKHKAKKNSYPSLPLALPPCQGIQTLHRSQNPRRAYISKSLSLTQNSVAQRHVRSWSANSELSVVENV
jgi:hypothetical protein